MCQTIATGEYLYSSLSNDPDLKEIVAMFVKEMPDRTAVLLGELNAGDWEGMQRTIHQLKGAAGSYGFDSISQNAAKLESVLRNQDPEEKVRAAVTELVDLCNRARCGVPR
jgi:HPt (histidine-containing phosphotransfer) domain-containing protein